MRADGSLLSTDADPAEANGIFVPPGDDRAMAAAIRHLIANPREAEAMGMRGRALVAGSMTVEHFATRVAALVRGDGSTA
jgi:glycosyltransferase involved in cell wall biosynthesis